MERICTQGHVMDIGKELCSRCNGVEAVSVAPQEEIIEEVKVKKVRSVKPNAVAVKPKTGISKLLGKIVKSKK